MAARKVSALYDEALAPALRLRSQLLTRSAVFLLIAYYAACGLASILAGQRYAVGRLRLAGLALAIYAAVKAIAEASEIGGLLLRVGAYGAVGVFLLAAGYLYREGRVLGERDTAPSV